jgi:hypothetical protein
MAIIVGIGTRQRDHTPGYFFCPRCRSRKPCSQGSRVAYFTLFFVPLIPLASRGEYYRCGGCSGTFDPDDRYPYDFGDHASPKRWTCSSCGSDNLSHVHRCTTCGADA